MRIWLVDRPDTVIGAYWPIKGEFDPLPALHRWKEGRRAAGPAPAAPHRPAGGEQGAQDPHLPRLVPGLPDGGGRLRHPQAQGHRAHVPTLLFVPCVGCGRGGYRLGYGGGFTTAPWPRCSRAPPPWAWDTPRLPGRFEPEAHDLPLDAILNDNGVVWPV